MAYSYLTPTNIFKRYQSAKDDTDKLTEPFPEFARIARNRPFEGIDPAYPKTTDGTTASIIQKTPKRVVQQLPTGVIESDDENSWLPIVAQFIYTNKIIPYANEDYGLFEKSQLIIENGLTFGAGASYAPFMNHDGYFCPDLTLPYWGDIFLQKGKKSGAACSYIFIRAWWQKEDIKALIDSETKLASEAKKRGETYEATWDTAELKELLDNSTSKDQQARTPNEDERNTNPDGIELVTAFQKGVGAKFYTFNPGTKKVVRTKVNKDPRGKIPIDWFYGDIDGNNPLGRGIVELVGGLQNLIDSDMQMYQYNRALMLAPPVIKYGNLGEFKYQPNFVVEGTNPQTDQIIPLKIDTTAIANYPQLYGLQKSQLLNLVNSPDSSISSEIGNPGFGKTPTALNQQKAAISVDDNAVRKRFETWFANWSETAINLYFAERSGKELLQLDKETAEKLRKLEPTEDFDPTTAINDKNQLVIDYDTATPALKFRVDASTSKMKDDADQLQAIVGLLEAVENNQMLMALMQQFPEKLLGAYNSLVSNSGVEDPEKLKITEEEYQQKQVEAQQAQQAQQAQAVQQQQSQGQLPDQEDAMLQRIVEEYRQQGIPDDQIAQAIQIYNQQRGVVNV